MTSSRSPARSSRTTRRAPVARARASRPGFARGGSRGAFPQRAVAARAGRHRFAGARGTLRRQAGFSLLEVLVAFVILALVGTAIFRLFGGALGNAAAADEWSRATLLAEARLVQAATADPLREASDSGTEDDGRLRWETKVVFWEPADVSPEARAASEPFPIRLFRVTSVVRLPSAPGRDRAVTLETVRIGARESK